VEFSKLQVVPVSFKLQVGPVQTFTIFGFVNH